MRIQLAITIFLSLIIAPAKAQNAYELAKWAPPDTMAFVGWAGADAAAPAFWQSEAGKFCAEPDLIRFVSTPLSGSLRLLAKKLAAKGDVNKEQIELAKTILARLWHRPGILCLFKCKPDKEDDTNISFAFIWDIGDDAATLLDQLRGWIRQKSEKIEDESIAGVRFFHNPDDPIYFGATNKRWILVAGKHAAQKIAEHDATKSSFARSESHLRALEQLKVSQPFLYLNVQTAAIRDALFEMIENEKSESEQKPGGMEIAAGVWAVAAFTLFDSMLGSREFAKSIAFNEQFLETSAYARADDQYSMPCDFTRRQAIDIENLRWIPDTAHDATLMSWDPAAMFDSALATAEKIVVKVRQKLKVAESQPAISEKGWLSKIVQEKLRADVRADLLAHLGTHMMFYVEPEFSGSSMNLMIEVKNAAELRRGIDAWLKRLPPGIKFTTRQIGQNTLNILDLSKMGANLPPLMLSPCWTLTDHWLMISSVIPAGTRFLQARENSLPGATLYDQEEVKSFLAEHRSEKITGLSWSDEAAGFRPLYLQLAVYYPIATAAITQLLERSGIGTDEQPSTQPANPQPASQPAISFEKLPEIDVFTRHMIKTISYSTMQNGVRTYHGRYGTESVMISATGIAGGALAISVLLPSLARARELAKRTACAANLKGLGTAMYAYSNENNERFPPNFKMLIDNGSISPKSLICPSSDVKSEQIDKDLEACYIYIAGQSTDTDQRDVIAYERDNHCGEGGNVLYADSHVEWVSPYDKVLEQAEKTRKKLAK